MESSSLTLDVLHILEILMQQAHPHFPETEVNTCSGLAAFH